MEVTNNDYKMNSIKALLTPFKQTSPKTPSLGFINSLYQNNPSPSAAPQTITSDIPVSGNSSPTGPLLPSIQAYASISSFHDPISSDLFKLFDPLATAPSRSNSLKLSKSLDDIEHAFKPLAKEIPEIVKFKLKNKKFKRDFRSGYLNHCGVRAAKQLDYRIQQHFEHTEQIRGITARKALAEFMQRKNSEGFNTKTLLLRSIAKEFHPSVLSYAELDYFANGWIQSSMQRAILNELDRTILKTQGQLAGSFRGNFNEGEIRILNTKIATEKAMLDLVFDNVLATINAKKTAPLKAKNGELFDPYFVNKCVAHAVTLLISSFNAHLENDQANATAAALAEYASVSIESSLVFSSSSSTDLMGSKRNLMSFDDPTESTTTSSATTLNFNVDRR